MLDNLVESRNNSRAVRKTYGFLVSTFFVLVAMLLSATVWSLFAKDFGMGNGGLELSDLVNPIAVAEPAPKPEPDKPKRQNQTSSEQPQVAVRRTNMARVDEAQIVPDKISVAPNAGKARPNSAVRFDPNGIETDASSGNQTVRSNNKDNITGFNDSDANKSEAIAENNKVKIAPPPALKKPEEKPKTTTISLGVVNGQALSLPKPPYPPTAKAVGASGAVQVQVLIDENGNVASAKAVNGHPLLRDAAERAAKNARFTPTKLSNVPVKVNGLIVYNFTK